MVLKPLADATHLIPKFNDVPVDGLDFGFDFEFDVLEDEEDLVLDYLADEFLLPEKVRGAESGASAAEFVRHGRFLNIMHLFEE